MKHLPVAVAALTLAALGGALRTPSGAAEHDSGTDDPAAARRVTVVVGSQVTCVGGRETICAGHDRFQVPSDAGVLMRARALAFGLRHGCALAADGAVSCWGDALDGQLGVDPETIHERLLYRPIRTAPAPVPGAPRLESLVAGWVHTCGATADGGVICWGDDARAQLGRSGDDATGAPAAAPVGGLPRVSDLAAGGLHTCVLDTGGGVRCWGDGSYGQLGRRDAVDLAPPAPVEGLPGPVKMLATGAYHTCAALADGSAWCWGDNRFGQLGDGTTERRLSPTRVVGLTDPVHALAAGASFTCAVGGAGEVRCWGSNEFGELGSGETVSEASEPARRPTPGPPVAGLVHPVREIAAGELHACVVTTADDVLCWGSNDSGQLGDGTFTIRDTPVAWTGQSPTFTRPPPIPLDPPLEGIDVSYHSGRVDWAAAQADGYVFGFMLATAGVDFRDPFLAAHWARLGQTSMARGAYHFFVAADDAEAQAHHFLSHVTFEPGDLPPVVDVESAASDVSSAELAAGLEIFVAEVERVLGVKPVIYTSPVFWRTRVGAGLGDHPLWIAEYEVDTPVVPDGWSTWHIWQWKGNADLSHIARVVDLNRVHADINLDPYRLQAPPSTPEP